MDRTREPRVPSGDPAAARSPDRGLPELRILGSFPKPEDGPPCHLCPARCCRYIALEIDRPVDERDHDQIRWYLLHHDTAVWVQDGAWHLEIRTRCRHLLPDDRCAIYDTRPRICREHGLPENGSCEFFSDGTEYDLMFESAEAFEAWSKRELDRRSRRLARRRARYRRAKEAS